MNTDLVMIAVLAGGATWAFRALPTLLLRGDAKPGGVFERFLAATGPAAITTLFVASVLPQFYPQVRELLPLAIGTGAVILAYLPRRSVVMATMAGAIGYGAAVGLGL